jgi:hypothetical protein
MKRDVNKRSSARHDSKPFNSHLLQSWLKINLLTFLLVVCVSVLLIVDQSISMVGSVFLGCGDLSKEGDHVGFGGR